jgi:hypothetical protein
VPNTHPLTAEHRRHDRLLVARHAVGDAHQGQDHEAQELIRRCSECAALAADIGAISRAVRDLPAAVRPRDFRLTVDQAARLRGSRLERWLRTITGSGWQTVRPVAAVALSVGLVMSIVGVVPMLGAATPGPRYDSGAPVAAGQPSPEQTADNRTSSGDQVPSPAGAEVNPPGEGVKVPTTPAPNNIDNAYLAQTSPAPGSQSDGTSDVPKAPDGGTGPGLAQMLLLVGLGLTALALVVLVLLYAARQRFYDPLLR